MTLTEKQLARNQQAARKHGAYAFQSSGEASLAPEGRSRLAEIRELVRTQPGNLQLRQELAARTVMLAELGLAHLEERYGQAEGDERFKLWSDPILARLGTFIAEARRQLETLPTDKGRKTLNEVMNG